MINNSCAFGCKGNLDSVGVLIAQLGTPDAPTAKALRPYLKQFLSDPRVIETNRVLWWFILNFIVLTTRPKRSARLYSRIWRPEGSPLLLITQEQTKLVKEALKNLNNFDIPVEFGMRYGKPSLESAVDKLIEQGCSKIVIFPMYPQYSATTTAATYDAIFKHLLTKRWIPSIKVVDPYFVHPSYIRALAATVNDELKKMPFKPERLVLSYHGIPEKYTDRGDPYCCMCVETTQAMLPHLDIESERVVHTFQSRFGRDPWLRPYTDVTLESLAKEGIKSLAVFAPGFPADCLETLDELGNEGKEQFTEHGGVNYHQIPCTNSHPAWIEGMTRIIQESLGSWVTERGQPKFACLSCPVKAA